MRKFIGTCETINFVLVLVASLTCRGMTQCDAIHNGTSFSFRRSWAPTERKSGTASLGVSAQSLESGNVLLEFDGATNNNNNTHTETHHGVSTTGTDTSILSRGWNSYRAGAMYVHLNYLTLFKPVVAYFAVLETILGTFSVAVAMGFGSKFWIQHDVVTTVRVYALIMDRAHSWISWPMRFIWNRFSVAEKMKYMSDKPLVKVAIANIIEPFLEEFLFRSILLSTTKRLVCLISSRWRNASIRNDLIPRQNSNSYASKLKNMPPAKTPRWVDLLRLSPWAWVSSAAFAGVRLGFLGQKKTLFGDGFEGQKDRIYILSCLGQAIKGFYSSAYVLGPVYEAQGFLAAVGAHTAMLISAPFFWVRIVVKFGPRMFDHVLDILDIS